MACNNVPEIFGSLVFNDEVMRSTLPKEVYRSLHKTVEEGKELDITLANAVAHAMKVWAISKGATHYTHWFQPMTGITAEKHDSFITPAPGGKVIMEFSGKELIKGESDASSFPSGGIRSTFEARGYTAWDPTSYAFIKDDSLCIPTVFCSYTGEVLDKKTPLLRSTEELSKQAVRVLNLIGVPAKRVISTVGPEQEYFLVDRELYEKRKDLVLTGRTLFGAKSPKSQEMDDHYFGAIKPRVMAYMHDLDEELWKLGILAKTEHNEAAPAQHELAPVYTTTNLATDHNQLTMEVMKKVAKKHGLTCLLHEKPFAGVNGSGKHNNWSISTDSGKNLLDPGKDPKTNTTFLLFLTAVIKAVDDYQDLLRVSAASAGNDHRLGASEAPPAIVSVFLGDDLSAIVDAIKKKDTEFENVPERVKMETGVDVLPDFMKDTTDRNRTSPFAFTGNKFEFRMIGSAASVAGPNIILNTIVAESLSQFADELESVENPMDQVMRIIRRELKAHSRILFDGNGYADEWVEEAERRGLLNLKTTADALPYYIAQKNIELFEKHHIFTEIEVHSRYEILSENYCKAVNAEALTMLEMAKKQFLPAAIKYSSDLAAAFAVKMSVGIDVTDDATFLLSTKLSKSINIMYKKIAALDEAVAGQKGVKMGQELANYMRDVLIPAMDALRSVADEIEVDIPDDYMPYPTYTDLLFGV